MIDIATLNTLIAAARVEVDIAHVRAVRAATYVKAARGALTDPAMNAILDFAYATSALRTLELVRDSRANLGVLNKIVDRAKELDPNARL